MYSKLDAIPRCFNGETAFINFCSIRAFPNTQMHRMIDSIDEDWLPWSEDVVRVLLEVALGQVGTISNGTLAWRPLSDWQTKVNDQLVKKAEILRNTPRNHRAI